MPGGHLDYVLNANHLANGSTDGQGNPSDKKREMATPWNSRVFGGLCRLWLGSGEKQGKRNDYSENLAWTLIWIADNLS